MIKLDNEQEVSLRKLLYISRRMAEDVREKCNMAGELPQCKDAIQCLHLIEKVEKDIGLKEDKPNEGTKLLNQKLPFKD